MSAPMKFDLEGAEPLGKETLTPADLAITVRDLRFCREKKPSRWWLNGNPVATAWHNALSASFPKGETMFIEAVRAHREGTPPKLEAEIRAFIKQEANHTREHVAFNRLACDAGYDLSSIEAAMDAKLDIAKGRTPIANLAATAALEHITALVARETLGNPENMKGAQHDIAHLWCWHATEEIEHKGVAYDTWLHATRDWGRWQRWKLKVRMALVSSYSFTTGRLRETLELMRQDGLTGWKWKGRLAAYLLWRPGLLRRTFPSWLAYFMPGFHPWKHDDRALIRKFDSEFPDAEMPAE
jgi:predicted metal-dependent hydrolase